MQVNAEATGPEQAAGWCEAARYGAALLVVGAVVALTQLIGGRFAATAAASPVLTQAATRYAIVVTTQLTEVVLAFVALWLFFHAARWGSFRQLGLSGEKFHSFVDGIALTIGALVAATALIAALGVLGPLRVQFPGPWPTLLALTAAIHAGFLEELAFRSLMLQGIEQIAGRKIAIAATAMLFTVLHVLAPFKLTAAWWIAVATAGVGLAWIFYAAGRNLWLPTGLHLGFDLGVFLLFGLPGETRGAMLWQAAGQTPALTREAGWVLVIAAAFTALVLLLTFRRRGLSGA